MASEPSERSEESLRSDDLAFVGLRCGVLQVSARKPGRVTHVTDAVATVCKHGCRFSADLEVRDASVPGL